MCVEQIFAGSRSSLGAELAVFASLILAARMNAVSTAGELIVRRSAVTGTPWVAWLLALFAAVGCWTLSCWMRRVVAHLYQKGSSAGTSVACQTEPIGLPNYWEWSMVDLRSEARRLGMDSGLLKRDLVSSLVHRVARTTPQ